MTCAATHASIAARADVARAFATLRSHAPTAIAELDAPRAYLSRHSRSFGFAAALLPAAERDRVTRVYAWCRFTDDLVDHADGDVARTAERLDAWIACARAAYEGRRTGIALVDRVMGDMAERGIPFAYAEELAAGVRSDLHFASYDDVPALRVYAHRVAGVVGCWLSELHGVRDRWMLERAAALGHAMQVTNILRDVGEDWDRGRLYLPQALLARHGVSPADVAALRRGARPVDAAWRALTEELASVAARDYALAREAIPHLPPGFRRAVAVAAAVYEGILDAIRRNGHDNVTRRAYTTAGRKLALAAGAIVAAGRRGARPADAALGVVTS
jgi:15-cis-phytoene synthase